MVGGLLQGVRYLVLEIYSAKLIIINKQLGNNASISLLVVKRICSLPQRHFLAVNNKANNSTEDGFLYSFG